MPKSFTAVSIVAVTLVVFGLALSPRVAPPQAEVVSTSSPAATTTGKKTSAAKVRPSPAMPAAAATATAPVTLKVTIASTTTQTDATLVVEGVSSGVVSGQSVLDAMRSLRANGMMLFVETEYPGLGAFVESINGKKNENGFYWFLYINDVSSSGGASVTIVHPGDAVEWRYKKS